MQSDDTLIDFNGSDNDKVRDKRLLRGPSLRVYHQGVKNGMEEWSVPLFSNLTQDECGFILFEDLVDLWTNLGVADISNCIKRLQVQVVDDRISVNDVRHMLDTSIQEFPLGNALLASYKTEILFLWEQFENVAQQTEKLRTQCTAAEDRNTVLIQDVEVSQSRLGEEHNSMVNKVEREWKEKLDKSKSMLQNEIEFLDTSISRQRENYENEITQAAQIELTLKQRYKDSQLEIKDLRGRIDEMKEYIEKLEDDCKKSKLVPEIQTEVNTSNQKPDFDLDASSMVEEYEKYIRDMQDKIDEQNQTINSLKDQADARSNSILSSTRNDPDGEEDIPPQEISDDEFGYENALKQHGECVLTSTPTAIKGITSMADELRQNGFTPKRLGELLNEYDEKSTQTLLESKSSKEVSCELKTPNEILQENIAKELEERLHYALQDSDRIGNLVTENDDLSVRLNHLETVIKDKEEQVIQLIDKENISRNLSNQYASTLTTLESKIAEVEECNSKISATNEISTQEVEKLKSDCQELQSKFDASTIQLKDSTINEENIQNEIKAYATKIPLLESELANKDIIIHHDKSVIAILEQTVVDLQNEFDNTTIQLQASNTKEENIQNEIKTYASKIPLLENELQNKDIIIHHDKSMIAILEQTVIDLQNKNTVHTSEVQQLISNNTSLKADINQEKESRATSQKQQVNEIMSIEKEVNNLKEVNTDLESSIYKLNNLVESEGKLTIKLKDELSVANIKLTDALQAIEISHMEKERLNNELKVLVIAINEKKSSTSSDSTKLVEEVNHLTNAIKMQAEEFQKKELEIENKLVNANATVKQFEEDNQRFLADNETMCKTLSEQAEEISTLKCGIESFKKKILQSEKQNKILVELRQQILKLEMNNSLSSKALCDKDTLIEVLHKKGRSKKQKIRQKCENLYETTLSLRNDLDTLKSMSRQTEDEMKNELNEMEKQLHKAILQSEELERKLSALLNEKILLLSQVTSDASKKSDEVAELQTQLALITELEHKHQHLNETEKKRFEEKILILRDNDRRSQSKIRQLTEEVETFTTKIASWKGQQDDLAKARERIRYLDERNKCQVKQKKDNTVDIGIQYDGIEVTQVITEEITETVHRRIPTRKEASPSTFIEVIFDDDSDDQDEFDRNDNNRSTISPKQMRSNACEIEQLELSIRSLEKENYQLKKDLATSGVESIPSGQVETLKEKIQTLETANTSLREEERRLVQEMKHYRQKNYKSFIGYSRNNNCLKLFDEDEKPNSELFEVAVMRDSLGLPPITPTQIIKLENENRDLTAKLRKTRIMLNDNTTRFTGSTSVNHITTTPCCLPSIFKHGLSSIQNF